MNWILNMGCHRGTLMSRDSIREEYASLADCQTAAMKKEKAWREIGYSVWFAYAIGPDMERVELRQGSQPQT